jgi:hypothetical protein
MERPSAEACPRTSTRSPGWRSCRAKAVAFVKSFWPGATRRIRVVLPTCAFTSEPESGVSVIDSPWIDLIVPATRAIWALCPAAEGEVCAWIAVSATRQRPALKAKTSARKHRQRGLNINLNVASQTRLVRGVYELLLVRVMKLLTLTQIHHR